MAPAPAPTPVPMSAPLPAPYPVPAPTAAPAPAPTAAPPTVPHAEAVNAKIEIAMAGMMNVLLMAPSSSYALPVQLLRHPRTSARNGARESLRTLTTAALSED